MKWLNNKTEGLINFSDLKSEKVKVAYTVMIIFLVVLAISCLLPVVWAAMSALKQPEEMYRIPPTFFPTTVDLSRVKKNCQSSSHRTLFVEYDLDHSWLLDCRCAI